MTDHPKGTLAHWAMRYLAVAIIVSGLWLLDVLGTLVLGIKISFGPKVVLLLIVWAAWISHVIGMRALPSMVAALLSLLYAFSGAFLLFTPGPLRLLGVLYLGIGVFLYLYSTKTWALHERFWLAGSAPDADPDGPI